LAGGSNCTPTAGKSDESNANRSWQQANMLLSLLIGKLHFTCSVISNNLQNKPLTLESQLEFDYSYSKMEKLKKPARLQA
jgi:hypothetical protein